MDSQMVEGFFRMPTDSEIVEAFDLTTLDLEAFNISPLSPSLSTLVHENAEVAEPVAPKIIIKGVESYYPSAKKIKITQSTPVLPRDDHEGPDLLPTPKIAATRNKQPPKTQKKRSKPRIAPVSASMLQAMLSKPPSTVALVENAGLPAEVNRAKPQLLDVMTAIEKTAKRLEADTERYKVDAKKLVDARQRLAEYHRYKDEAGNLAEEKKEIQRRLAAIEKKEVKMLAKVAATAGAEKEVQKLEAAITNFQPEAAEKQLEALRAQWAEVSKVFGGFDGLVDKPV